MFVKVYTCSFQNDPDVIKRLTKLNTLLTLEDIINRNCVADKANNQNLNISIYGYDDHKRFG